MPSISKATIKQSPQHRVDVQKLNTAENLTQKGVNKTDIEKLGTNNDSVNKGREVNNPFQHADGFDKTGSGKGFATDQSGGILYGAIKAGKQNAPNDGRTSAKAATGRDDFNIDDIEPEPGDDPTIKSQAADQTKAVKGTDPKAEAKQVLKRLVKTHDKIARLKNEAQQQAANCRQQLADAKGKGLNDEGYLNPAQKRQLKAKAKRYERVYKNLNKLQAKTAKKILQVSDGKGDPTASAKKIDKISNKAHQAFETIRADYTSAKDAMNSSKDVSNAEDAIKTAKKIGEGAEWVMKKAIGTTLKGCGVPSAISEPLAAAMLKAAKKAVEQGMDVNKIDWKNIAKQCMKDVVTGMAEKLATSALPTATKEAVKAAAKAYAAEFEKSGSHQKAMLAAEAGLKRNYPKIGVKTVLSLMFKAGG